MLNVQRLRVLREVVARGSFSAAADALDYTQSAVSQAVATLEAGVGAPLTARARRGLRPTAAGAALVEHTDGILARLEAAEEDLAAIIGLRKGRLRMASFPTAGATLMPLAIATFRDRHGDIELSLAEGEPEEIEPRLRAGERELALPSVRDDIVIRALFPESPMRRVLAATAPSPRGAPAAAAMVAILAEMARSYADDPARLTA